MSPEPIPERVTIETDSLTLRRRRPRSGLLGLASFGLFIAPIVFMMLAGGLLGVTKPAGWGAMVSASWLSAIAVALIALITRAGEMPRKGRLEIEDGALTVGWGKWKTRLAQGTVVSGSVTPRIGGALLLLGLDDGRSAAAHVPSVEAGARVLQALSIEPLGRALTADFKSGITRSLAGFGVGFASILVGGWLKDTVDLSSTSGIAWLAICLSLIGAWLVGTRPPEVSVGADGVHIRGKISTRFIALADIASARVEGIRSTLVITLRSGGEDRTRVPLGNGPMIAAVAHRIELALAARPASPESPTRLSLLERDGRSIAAWKTELRGRVASSDYRKASLADGDLAAIVGSAGASAEHRIGAAIALRAAGGDDARARIRLAAEQCASPPVRIALQKIARAGRTGERPARDEAAEAEREAESGAEEDRALADALAATSP